MNEWETVWHQDGRIYFWNTITNETTWIKPKEMDEDLDNFYEYEENEMVTENSLEESDHMLSFDESFDTNMEPPAKIKDPPPCPKLYNCVSVKSSQELLTSAVVRVKLQYRSSESHPVKMLLTIGSNGKIMDHLWNMVNSQNIFIDRLKSKLRETGLEYYFEKCVVRLIQYSFKNWKEFSKDEKQNIPNRNDNTHMLLSLLNDQLTRLNSSRIEKCMWNFILLQMKRVFCKWSRFTFTGNDLDQKYMNETLYHDICFSGVVFSEYVKTKKSFEKRLKNYRKLATVLQERLSNSEKKYKILKHEKNEFLRLLIEVKTSRARENWNFMNGSKSQNNKNELFGYE